MGVTGRTCSIFAQRSRYLAFTKAVGLIMSQNNKNPFCREI